MVQRPSSRLATLRLEIPPDGPLWSIPLPAGEPRRLGNFEGTGGAGYFPDGHLVFTQGRDLFVADADGANPRKLASATGIAYFPSVSPDGQRIVFMNGSSVQTLSLVEVGSDGKRMRTLYDGPSSGCGVWTPDGKYLLYHDWAATEGRISGRSRWKGHFFAAQAGQSSSRLGRSPIRGCL